MRERSSVVSAAGAFGHLLMRRPTNPAARPPQASASPHSRSSPRAHAAAAALLAWSRPQRPWRTGQLSASDRGDPLRSRIASSLRRIEVDPIGSATRRGRPGRERSSEERRRIAFGLKRYHQLRRDMARVVPADLRALAATGAVAPSLRDAVAAGAEETAAALASKGGIDRVTEPVRIAAGDVGRLGAVLRGLMIQMGPERRRSRAREQDRHADLRAPLVARPLGPRRAACRAGPSRLPPRAQQPSRT